MHRALEGREEGPLSRSTKEFSLNSLLFITQLFEKIRPTVLYYWPVSRPISISTDFRLRRRNHRLNRLRSAAFVN